MQFIAPLALAAIAAAAPAAKAEADATAVADPTFIFPTYAGVEAVVDVLEHLTTYLRDNGDVVSPHVPLIGVGLNAFVAGLYGCGINVNVL